VCSEYDEVGTRLYCRCGRFIRVVTEQRSSAEASAGGRFQPTFTVPKCEAWKKAYERHRAKIRAMLAADPTDSTL